MPNCIKGASTPHIFLLGFPNLCSHCSLQDLYGDVVGRGDVAGEGQEPCDKEGLQRKDPSGGARGGAPGGRTGGIVQPPVAEQFKVTVSRLQWWTSDADLEELFSAYGKIRKIIFQEEKNNGKSKGVALIQFAEA